MEKRISGFKTITFAGFTALLLLSGCASSKPVASKDTPQQLILQNRKTEAMQEFVMPTDINAMDENGNTVLHVAAQVNDAELVTYFIFKGADPELKNYDAIWCADFHVFLFVLLLHGKPMLWDLHELPMMLMDKLIILLNIFLKLVELLHIL